MFIPDGRASGAQTVRLVPGPNRIRGINGKDYSGFASAHHLGDDVVELVGLAKQGLARKVAPVIERGSPV